MVGFFLRWSINLLALVVAGLVIPGIGIHSVEAGIIAAGVLSIVNAVIRPIVLLLTLPLTVLTLGLFTLVVNAVFLKLIADTVPGFTIDSFSTAFFGGILISIISSFLNMFVGSGGASIIFKKASKGGDGGPHG
ncbi:MAG: phage holin family protein [Nitrospirota bacterium]